MKKTLKFIGTSLCGIALLAGCTKENDQIKANISNPSDNVLEGLKEDTKNVTLEQIYNNLRDSSGNTQVANKLLEIIADLVLSDDLWKTRYETKMNEKLLELTENETYQDDNGIFSEELLVRNLKSKLYEVTCDVDVYGPTYTDSTKTVVDKYILCDYTDYKNKALKIEVLTELLNEKYVYDKVLKDKTNLIDTKKTRLVEYITLDSSNEDAFEFITSAVSEIKDGTTLEGIKDEWVDKLIKEIEDNYNKINTIDDKDGSIFKEFTNEFNYSKEEGLRLKKKAVYDGIYYNKQTINNDNKDILNTTLVERIVSDNVLDDSVKKTIKINDNYYLVSPLAGTSIDESDIRLTDTSNSKYYIVRVETMPKYADLSDEEKVSNEKIYEAVKLLASNTTLVSDSVKYYLEQYKNDISVHDEEVYNYLKTQYSSIFVD